MKKLFLILFVALSLNANAQGFSCGQILIPAPPGAGNYVLKSVDGVVSWIAE